MTLRIASLVALTMLVAVSSATAGGDRHVHLFVGKKGLPTSDWGPFDGQNEVGLVTTSGGRSWPVSIAVDAFYSETSVRTCASEIGCNDDQVETYELALGVRKLWRTGIIRLGLGGGMALIGASAEIFAGDRDVDGRDKAIGPWAGAVCYFHVADGRVDIGAHVGWSHAEIEIPSVNPFNASLRADAGGWRAGITLGGAW